MDALGRARAPESVKVPSSALQPAKVPSLKVRAKREAFGPCQFGGAIADLSRIEAVGHGCKNEVRYRRNHEEPKHNYENRRMIQR